MRRFSGISDPLVPMNFPALLVKVAAERGASAERVLEGTSFTEPMLASPNARMSFGQVRQLTQNVLAFGGDPGLGFEVGSQAHVARLGILGYAAMSARTLGAAIELAVSYHRILVPFLDLQFRREGDIGVLAITESMPLGELRPCVREAAVTCMVQLAGFMVENPPTLRELRFDYPEPLYAARYRQRFDCPISFDAPATESRFDAAALTLPLVYACEATARMAEEQCAVLLQPVLDCEGVVKKVETLLRTRPGESPSVKHLARTLRTSERSLRRALSDNGTTYRELLDQVRKKLAIEYLSSTAIPMEDIARSIGFGSSRSFRRAFHRWTGEAPSTLRARRRAQPAEAISA